MSYRKRQKRHNIVECPNVCCRHNTHMNVDEFRCVDCVTRIYNIKQIIQDLMDDLD